MTGLSNGMLFFAGGIVGFIIGVLFCCLVMHDETEEVIPHDEG